MYKINAEEKKLLIQHFDQKCHPFVASDIFEDFLPVHSEIFIVALGHHLKPSLDEGFPRDQTGPLQVREVSDASSLMPLSTFGALSCVFVA